VTLDPLPAIRALDLFAGVGWGVACQAAGIDEHGVELMPEAVATRRAAGMRTVIHDAWDGLDGTVTVPAHDLQIASPPCQTFSISGNGSGRKALGAVLELIHTGAYKEPGVLREWGPKLGHDDRTALVLVPLAYAYRDRPRLIVWEQVPTVLPVWEAAATELRALGYSVVTGVLQAEAYGVPQTRRRAILIARRDGAEATMPPATHSRYHLREPRRMDPGVLPWVSMAAALQLPPGDERVMRSNYGTDGDPAARGERTASQPAPTVTSRVDRNKWVGAGQHAAGNVNLAEASVLQSFPADFPWQGKTAESRFIQVGNAVPPLLARAILDHVTREA
jgi:DNA (cytosine-5)-methyltransferase 1